MGEVPGRGNGTGSVLRLEDRRLDSDRCHDSVPGVVHGPEHGLWGVEPESSLCPVLLREWTARPVVLGHGLHQQRRSPGVLDVRDKVRGGGPGDRNERTSRFLGLIRQVFRGLGCQFGRELRIMSETNSARSRIRGRRQGRVRNNDHYRSLDRKTTVNSAILIAGLRRTVVSVSCKSRAAS